MKFQRDSVVVERLRHGLRTAIGCAVGYLLARWLNLQSGQWVVITVALVMCSEPRTGGLLRKSVQRFWGTVLGAGAALLILFVLPGTRELGLLWALPALLAFGYLADDAERSYMGVLGSVTLVMVVMEPSANFEFAGQRILQIILGLVVAVAVSQLVLPDHARLRLRRSVSAFLQALADLAAEDGQRDEIEPKIVASLSEQRKLIGEAIAEGEKVGRELLEQLITAERRAFRYAFILSQVSGTGTFLPELSRGLQVLADRVKGGDEWPVWPTAETSTDPVHKLCAERLLEACQSLEGCLRAVAVGRPSAQGVEPSRHE